MHIARSALKALRAVSQSEGGKRYINNYTRADLPPFAFIKK